LAPCEHQKSIARVSAAAIGRHLPLLVNASLNGAARLLCRNYHSHPKCFAMVEPARGGWSILASGL